MSCVEVPHCPIIKYWLFPRDVTQKRVEKDIRKAYMGIERKMKEEQS
jgi:hypothetical protein